MSQRRRKELLINEIEDDEHNLNYKKDSSLDRIYRSVLNDDIYELLCDYIHFSLNNAHYIKHRQVESSFSLRLSISFRV